MHLIFLIIGIIQRDRDDTRTFRFWIIFKQKAPEDARSFKYAKQ